MQNEIHHNYKVLLIIVAKLSCNLNYILVESWDSLILSFNTHPASHHIASATNPTEKVVNHLYSEYLLLLHVKIHHLTFKQFAKLTSNFNFN